MNERDNALYSAIYAATGKSISPALPEIVRAILPGTTEEGRTKAMATAAIYSLAGAIREIAKYEASQYEVYRKLARCVVAGFTSDPGTSDLDNEQPIFVRMTLGDYRAAARLEL